MTLYAGSRLQLFPGFERVRRFKSAITIEHRCSPQRLKGEFTLLPHRFAPTTGSLGRKEKGYYSSSLPFY
jgi:hypothetical protein